MKLIYNWLDMLLVMHYFHIQMNRILKEIDTKQMNHLEKIMTQVSRKKTIETTRQHEKQDGSFGIKGQAHFIFEE